MKGKFAVSFLVSILLVSFIISSRCAHAKVIGAWLFDEGSGEEAKDSSGRDVDGVLVGGPEWVDGVFGKALKLEPNKYVDFPPMFGPVKIQIDSSSVRWVSFGINEACAPWANSTTGWRPCSIKMSRDAVIPASANAGAT